MMTAICLKPEPLPMLVRIIRLARLHFPTRTPQFPGAEW